MADRAYKATLSKGRSGWCVIYRHPLVKTPDQRQQLRVRRGLGTRDDAEAQGLVDELNQILGDKTYWNSAARSKASAKFASNVVAAFYDYIPIEPGEKRGDGWAERERAIPLPGAEEGYACVLTVGTTGSGKTTVVRQLIGTDPKVERFPSTSTAKTTVCDMEIVLAEGPFRAAVSFLPRDEVRQSIAECVSSAVSGHLEGSPQHEIIRRFVEHGDMRFRLNYILGAVNPPKAAVEDDLTDEEESDSPQEAAEVTAEERDQFAARLRGHLEAVQALAMQMKEEVAAQLDIDAAKANAQESDVISELVEESLHRNEDFHLLVDRILDDVESRFEYAGPENLELSRDGWPTVWQFETADRQEFIKAVNRFSSNYAPNFGRLLTPIVEGIRVSGPFKPDWADDKQPKLVLMDGQGIGHTADSTTSVSTGITRRFRLADAILLVDNAEQPMQGGAVSVLRTLVSSGHESKLMVAFTHFDEVKGDNLPDVAAKKDHVIGSFYGAVQAIGKQLGRESEQALKRLIPDRLVFLANIQSRLSKGAKLTRSELDRLVKGIESLIVPPPEVEYKPEYDSANLVLAIQKATQEFHDRWRGVLGFGTRSGVAPEHWTRIKALTRHVGILRREEYDNLRPTADLISLLQTRISNFLSNPVSWQPRTPPEGMEAEKIQAIDQIRIQVFTRLHELSKQRLIDERLSGWVSAFDHVGTGSTKVRARDVAALYESAAPVPNEMPGPDANEFLIEVRQLVGEAVIEGGGYMPRSVPSLAIAVV